MIIDILKKYLILLTCGWFLILAGHFTSNLISIMIPYALGLTLVFSKEE